MRTLQLLLPLILIASTHGVCRAEGNGTGPPAVKKQPVTRDHPFVRLPSSVVHTLNPEGQHVFTILGIADVPAYVKDDIEKGVFAQRPLDNFKPTIPGLVAFEINHQERKATLITSSPPSLAELTAAINETAKSRGDFPSWSELEARDIGKAAAFSDSSYTVSKPEAPPPAGLAWCHLLPNGTFSFSAPFSDGGPVPGRILIHSAPVPLGTQKHHTIRILDPDGKLIWTRTLPVPHGSLAIADTNNDGAHELLLHWTEKETESRLLIAPE